MKMNKLLSIMLAILLILSVLPVTAGAAYRTDKYGGVILMSSEPLEEWYNGFGVKTDYDVEFKGDTLYINTSKFIQIEVPQGNAKDFRIVFEHNANVAFNYLNIENTSDHPAITVSSGKTVKLAVWSNVSATSVNSSVFNVNGTLDLSVAGEFKVSAQNGYGFDGSGTVNLLGGRLIAEGTKGGVGVRNFNCSSATLEATGTALGAPGIGRADSVMNSLTLDHASVKACGGAGAVGIGTGTKGTLNSVVIKNSIVTAKCGSGAETDLGCAPGGTLKSLVIDKYSSVKGLMNVTPKDADGNELALYRMENPDLSSITVDDYVFPYRDHFGERAVYIYLAGEGHIFSADSEELYLGDFVITSSSPSFSPSGLSFDPSTGRLTVSTKAPFTISNKNKSVPTSHHIFIPVGTEANICLDGVNINTPDNAFEIEVNSLRNVNITLAQGSYNLLVSEGPDNCGIKKTSKKIWTGFEMAEPACGTLFIKGEGCLYAAGGEDASAIGCNNAEGAKNINFVSGDIIAEGGANAPAVNCRALTVCSAAQVMCMAGAGATTFVTNTAKNESGTPVYQLTFSGSTEETVYVDGLATAYKPLSDRNFISFFTENTEHCVQQGDTKKYYRLNGQIFEEFTPSGDYDTGDFTVTGGEPYRDYTYANGVLTVKSSDPENAVTVSNKNKNVPTADTIAVPDGRDAYMILDGVNIDASAGSSAALNVKNAGNVYVILAEGSSNILKGGSGTPAIYKAGDKAGSTLTVRGEGALKVIGSGNRAIGANHNEVFAHFYVESGTLELSADGGSSVIGTGNLGGIKDIVFERANVTIAAKNGSCFGVGYGADIKDVSVHSGNVTFRSENGGIFSVTDKNALITNVGIYGGTVTADSGKAFFDVSSAEKQVSGLVIAPCATVYANRPFTAAPVDPDGTEAYLCPIENPEAEDIFIDGQRFPYTAHNDISSVYPYLSASAHLLTVGDTEYQLGFDKESGTFIFRQSHEHIFAAEWQHDENRHWHECGFEDCWLLPELYEGLSGDELTASGYGEHDFDDFVCVCGFEDVPGCRAYYTDMLKGQIIGNKDALEIRSKAVAELAELNTTGEIKTRYEKCCADIDAAIRDLSAAVANATAGIGKALDGYSSLLETEHGCDVTAIEEIAAAGINSLKIKSSLSDVNACLDETLRDMQNAALTAARMNASLEISLAASKVENPSESVTKTVLNAKKMIGVTDSLEDIFDIAGWAVALIGELGTPVHEHTFSSEFSKNDAAHWYAATCGHGELVKDMQAHTFGEGVTSGDTTVYSCTVCGYEKTVIDTDKDAVAKAVAAAKEAVGKLVVNETEDVIAYAENSKADIEKLTDIPGVIEKLTAVIAEINSMKTAKAVAAAVEELDNAAKNAVSVHSEALADAAKNLIENAESADAVYGILSDALKKIADEEKALADAKTQATNVIDAAAGTDRTPAMQTIVSEVLESIDGGRSTQDVESAKQAGLARIEAQKQAEKPAGEDLCPKCGRSHSDGFFGKIVCFFNRAVDWFLNLFR